MRSAQIALTTPPLSSPAPRADAVVADYRVGPLCHGAVRKHRVHVGNQQNAAATGSRQRSQQIISDRGRDRRHALDGGTETLKFSLSEGAHRCQAGNVTRAGVDLHELLQQCSRNGLAGFCGCKDLGVWCGVRRRRV